MMPGMIMLWAGSIADIPSGWAFCNGTLGTPDLRNRFIPCAQEDVAGVPKAVLSSFLTDSWELNLHTHDFTGDGHSHDLVAGAEFEGANLDPMHEHHTTISPASGTTNNQWTVPKSKVLVYIMKL